MHFIFLFLYFAFVSGVVLFTIAPLRRRLITWHRIWHVRPLLIAETPHLRDAAFLGAIQVESCLLGSPLTATPCVWWQLTIKEDRGRNYWITLGQRTSSVPFLVQDTSGTLVVDPRKSTPYLRTKASAGDPVLWNAPDLSETLLHLSQAGILDKKWLNPRRVWIRERYLVPNDMIYVQGWLVDALPHSRLSSFTKAPLIISDVGRSPLLSDLGVQIASLSFLIGISIIWPGLLLWGFW